MCKIERVRMRVRSGVNFINAFCTAFTLVDPESVKETVKLSIFFYAFGNYKQKTVHKNVDEIEPYSFPYFTFIFTFIIRVTEVSISSTLFFFT